MAREPTHRLLETDHGRIAVGDTGNGGLPLLLIHGNSSSRAIFRHQMTGPIAEKRRIVAFDLPGHGDSSDAPDPAKTYTIPGYASVAIEVLRQLGIAEAAVFGWSLGGHIGIEMMPDFPGLRGLMITGTPPLRAALAANAFKPSPDMALSGKETFSEADVDAYALATAGTRFERFIREAVARTDGRARRLMIEAALADSGIDQRRAVETNAVPLAVVNGAEDPLINLDYIDTIPFANLWEGRCHRLPGLGHAPFWEAPEVFDPILQRFLDDVGGARESRSRWGGPS